MSLVKDIIRTLREGVSTGDRPLLATMLCLFVLSLTLIAVGLAK